MSYGSFTTNNNKNNSKSHYLKIESMDLSDLSITPVIISSHSNRWTINHFLYNYYIYFKQIQVYIILLLCIIIGPINFILYKVLYSAFQSTDALFVSQCINLTYVLIGGLALLYTYSNNEITKEMKQTPHIKFILMGLLDCIAGYLSAIASSHVSGGAQQLINQTIIPITMILSYFLLNHYSSYLQIIGSMIILAGGIIVILPTIYLESSNSSYYLIYFISNIPFSLSFIYKEYGFKNLSIHVIYLTQWVSIYQLIIGFIIAPLQLLPGFGTTNGMSINELISSFKHGFNCFLENDIICYENNTFTLLISYCVVNFVYNTLGLYLVKYGNSILNSFSYSIILPLTTIAFSFPILGSYTEPLQYFTILGLTVVLIGFYVWKYEDISTNIIIKSSDNSNIEITGYVYSPVDSKSDSNINLELDNVLELESEDSYDDISDNNLESIIRNKYINNKRSGDKNLNTDSDISSKSIDGNKLNSRIESFHERVIVAGLI